MKTLTVNSLCMKLVLITVFAIVPISETRAVGIPVIDSANLSQTVVSAIENVAQTLNQIQQYKTQLQQYENMLQNTAAPAANVWDQATVTMNQLRTSIDTLNYYKNSLGSIDNYLGKFKDTAAYRSTPCYTPTGCSPAEWAAMRDSDRLGSASQKQATDALFRGLDQQHNAMQTDAGQLQNLQNLAQGATGQMQAIGYANQFASHQANQLLQIRGLLIAQQNVIATRNQALADREAKELAASAQIRNGEYRRSFEKNW